MNTVQLLEGMRSTIAKGWTQGCSARNRQGNPCVPCSPEAACWCLVGSFTHNPNIPMHVRISGRQAINSVLEHRNELPDIEVWNDKPGRTQQEVLDLLAEAITLASVGGYP